MGSRCCLACSKMMILMMRVWMLLFLICCMSTLEDLGGRAVACNAADLAALRSFAASFGLAGNFSDWDQTSSPHADCCAWPGVSCSSASSNGGPRVTNLSLDTWEMIRVGSRAQSYPIPTSVCGLSQLVLLRLSGPALAPRGLLAGSIPQCIGSHLTNLVELDLSGNFLTGSSIPLLSFPRLQTLRLSGNSFSGPVPSASLLSLPSLTTLALSGNIFSGPFPSSLPPSLITLELHGNGLSGPFPSSLSLPNLTTLDLSYNSFSGPFPSSLLSLPGLTTLDLSDNSFSGPFPSSLSSPGLTNLDLSDNSFSGPFPSSLSCPGLTNLDLSYNIFSGPLPSLFNCHLLQSLRLERNSFSGSIPSFNCPLLQYLHLSENFFSGNLSSLFGPSSTLPSLTHLDLGFNALSGQIPAFDPSCFPSLESLDLRENLLNGRLPDSLCGLNNLSWLCLNSNGFSGQFLQCKQPELNHLGSLYASFNNFSGHFPEWVGYLSELGDLELEHNSFSGSIPHSWQNNTSFVTLSLSGNSVIPESPGAPRLPNWFFASTSISYLSIGSMKLQDTDLSCSSLLNNTSLIELDLSQNDLTSDVLRCLNPSSQFPFSTLKLSENPLNFSLDDAEMVELFPHLTVSWFLDMSSCELSGHLSHRFLDHLSTLSFGALSLAHNNLVGRIPAHLGNLSYLQVLDLSHNYFTGIDALLPKFPQLPNLDVSNNCLEGSLSSLFSNITNMTADDCAARSFGSFSVDLSHNRLSGEVPPDFPGPCINAFVEKLKLNDNRLEGVIPNQFLQINNTRLFTNLETLSLSYNQLSGPIPASFKGLKSLALLDLSHNMLKGNLQDRDALFSNASFTRLRVLLLGYNDFTGSIPISLSDIAPALQLIDFSNNHLIGTIPVHTLQALPAFRNISPASRLTAPRGTLYEELRINAKALDQRYVYVLEALTSLDLSGNNLSGPISTGLGELAGLVLLNLSRNNFSGSIPSDLGKLSRQLQSLDLSFNALEGLIPPSFKDLTALEVFNVSYNKGLRGPIPNQPQFEKTENYIGDPNLCGSPTLRSCNTPHKPQSTMTHKEFSSKLVSWIDAWVSIPGFSLGIVVGFFGVLWILVFMDFF